MKIKSRFHLQFLCNATVGSFQISLPSWCYNKFRVSSLFADQASVPAPVCIYLNSRAKRTVCYSVLALRQSDRRNCGLCVGLYAESGAAPLSFKRATTMPNKLIDSQHYKQLRRKTLTAFHLLLHFTLTTTQLNLSFLKILNYSKTIRRLALSFRNPHLFHSNVTKTQATFQSGVHF